MTKRQLSHDEYSRFKKGQRRLLAALGSCLGYCAGIALIDDFVDLTAYEPYIGVGAFIVIAIVIWEMHVYCCPVCKKKPSTHNVSLGPDASKSFSIALFPKSCNRCGAIFHSKQNAGECE